MADVPIAYIVGALLAVAVIAVIAYLFFTQSSGFSGTINERVCLAKCMEWCGTRAVHKIDWEEYSPGCATTIDDCETRCG